MDDNTSKVYVEPDSSHAPLVAQNAGSGAQLFVINLCASIAPVSTTGRNIPGLENYKLYQVARVEDGRTRHRLRLGFFTNEAHAERVLTVVRQQYPTAFTTSLSDEDRRFARGYLPANSAPAPRPAVAVVNTAPPAPAAPAAAAPVPKAAPVAPKAAAPAAAKPAQPAAAKLAPAAKAPPTEKPVAAAKAPAAPKPAQPAKAAVAKAPVDEVVEMTWEPDEETKAAASSASLPKIKALTEAVGLDELSWDEEAPTLAPAPASSKEPLAVGLLSGKFAALDASKIKSGKSAAPEAAAPVAKAAAKPVTPPAPVAVPPKLDPAASVRVPALTFSDPEPTPAAAQKSKAGSNEPYHVGKGVRIEDVEAFELDLYDDAPAQPAAAAKKGAPAKPAAKQPAAPVAKKIEAPAKPAAPIAAKPAAPTLKQVPPAPVREASLKHPNLDSTQTIRALTTEELNDGAQEKWFAIQLAASEQPVNLDTMPHLDIFEAYSLYSVATAGSGKIVHSLRLGFFKEAVSAEAVAGYLKTFFASPSVLRISVAEQARFKDAPQPRRAEPEEPKNNVVELSNARANRAPVVPTVTMEVDTSATGAFRPNATGAFRPNATGALNSATGTFKPGATGAFKANATGAFKLNGTGVHKALDTRVAAKSASPATKRADLTGKHKSLKKSLAEELLEEAREVELSESGIRKLPQNNSLLSRLLGKKK
ncbi:hypothetical protein JM946_02445 [Steroidobacter sp. S1-65]|uniref:SPOR domain-containing protein n=1 Tax=Steroidobacter gossypii TaxID=2805490 RepID=A0ABS1WRI2_9GAMM|nr:hypothetical protein [Steroidobacter gossypii]MBM0103580.1 hypothetical protein [Steroidobacter gossypii]